MSSQRKILSCRANGAKNHGAKTPEAARRSAANNRKHGLLAAAVFLEDENLESFTRLADAIRCDLKPRNQIERDLVATIAVSRWRLLRLWETERRTLSAAIEKHDPSAPGRVALAFRQLSDESRVLDLLKRYEARFDRQYARSLTALIDLRAGRQARGRQAPPLSPVTQIDFCRSEPIPKSDT